MNMCARVYVSERTCARDYVRIILQDRLGDGRLGGGGFIVATTSSSNYR